MKISFNVYKYIKAQFEYDNGEASCVKLLTKVPTGDYNSFLNDAGMEAEKIAAYIQDVVKFTHSGNPKIVETTDFIDGVIYSYRFNNEEHAS
jgi:hypothetical protein